MVMRRTAITLALGLTLSFSGLGQGTTKKTAFVGVSVIPVTEELVLGDHTLIVEGDRITALGPSSSIKIPDDAVIVRGNGRFLIPGLAEMHGHIPPPSAPREYLDDVLFLYLANGITTVRGMLGSEGQLELRAKANSGAILSPNLYLAGPSFNGRSVNSPNEAVEKVRRQKREGWDLLKIHPGLTLEEYDAMANTAISEGISFAGHVPADVGLLHALKRKQETIDHLDGYIEYLKGTAGPIEKDKMVDIADRTRKAGTWLIPTMVLWETLLGVPDLDTLQAYSELKYMPPSIVESWTEAYTRKLNAPGFSRETARTVAMNRQRLLKVMSDRGVLILMGTDAPQQFSVPGFSLHRELVNMAESGMTPFQILASGTRNVGRYFLSKDRFGTLKIGNRADLVLVASNPLEDIGHLSQVEGVMVRGQWLSKEAIQQRLKQIAASHME
jgi:imidazolonepropionase-like amidohydrolase